RGHVACSLVVNVLRRALDPVVKSVCRHRSRGATAQSTGPSRRCHRAVLLFVPVPVTKEELDAKVEGQTICSRFLETVDAHGRRTALRARVEGGRRPRWESWTYREYADRVATAAAGLSSLGVRPGDRVMLMMRNIPTFHVIDLALTFCGATAVSIY